MCLSFTLHISIYPLHIFLSLHVVSISVHRVLIGQARACRNPARECWYFYYVDIMFMEFYVSHQAKTRTGLKNEFSLLMRKQKTRKD